MRGTVGRDGCAPSGGQPTKRSFDCSWWTQVAHSDAAGIEQDWSKRRDGDVTSAGRWLIDVNVSNGILMCAVWLYASKQFREIF